MSPLLSVRGLKAAYGASSALFGIDLDVQREKLSSSLAVTVQEKRQR